MSNKPELTASQELVWSVFIVLHAGRQEGFSGPQAINLSGFESLAKLTYEDPTDLFFILARLDNVYIVWWGDKHKND